MRYLCSFAIFSIKKVVILRLWSGVIATFMRFHLFLKGTNTGVLNNTFLSLRGTFLRISSEAISGSIIVLKKITSFDSHLIPAFSCEEKKDFPLLAGEDKGEVNHQIYRTHIQPCKCFSHKNIILSTFKVEHHSE